MPARAEPYSESQRRWAHAADARGELEPGTATRWSRRARRRRTDNPGVTLPQMPRAAQNRGWWAAAGILGLGLVLVLSSRRST